MYTNFRCKQGQSNILNLSICGSISLAFNIKVKMTYALYHEPLFPRNALSDILLKQDQKMFLHDTYSSCGIFPAYLFHINPNKIVPFSDVSDFKYIVQYIKLLDAFFL